MPHERRPLADLIDTSDPAWPMLRESLTKAPHAVEVLPRTQSQAETALVALQVTTRSMLGTVAFETGGILVDGGWLRILGSGHERLSRRLDGWNGLDGDAAHHRLPGAVLVADDVLGGFFALDGGAFGAGDGRVWYLSPDSWAWEPMDVPYSQFLNWAITGDLASFYATMRWPGWQAEIAPVTGEQAVTVYPFLWAKGPPIAERHRGVVPIEELWGVHSAGIEGHIAG